MLVVYIKWDENETMKTYVRTPLIVTDMSSFFAELGNGFQMLEEYFFICVL